MASATPTMNVNNLDSPPPSETFGQDAYFHLEQPIGAMSISPSGRDVVLASKEGLHIIDLDSPYKPPRYLPHRTPWEVADVQWSPFAVRDHWIVSTSNQKALVWNVGIAGWRDAIEFVLHGHTRAITDINFSAHHPDVLATCAVDSFVHGWDLRDHARPAFSFSDWFAGATQVKFSRQDEHVIASSHDRFLHIWDKRKGAHPVRTIEAHSTKIYGVDWNRFEPTKIVTCSLDKTIKFWDTNNPENIPDRVIETPFPVWRARHTPFGWGLLAMPQRGNNDLHLYDRRPVDGVLMSGAVPPVEVFHGHKSNVKEFLWRARGTIKEGVDHRDFQLVSWGTDSELRLHNVDESTFRAIGYEKGVSKPLRLNFTRRNARYRTFRDDANEAYSPIEMPGRNDSIQTYPQAFAAKARQSTNIGMSKISVAQFRGWLHSSKRERRTGMHGRSTVRQDMNPIAWMKNVKIASWDSESLADEITQVGERFTKIVFESIEIGQRKAVMSLQGPWGENGAMVNIRVDFRFPKAYPKDAAAIVTIYKNSSISENIHKTLSTEVNTISETYASRQRGCIEAIVRHLLHEQTMEQIVSWILGENMTDSKVPTGAELPNDLSSDSDDDNLDGRPDPSSSSANLWVPLAKGCGALWSTTGELVCFFPQKTKEPTSVLSKFSANGLGDSQSSRLFEGFGRLQTSSPARRPGTGTQRTVDDASSEMSDLVSTFSSSSSSSSSSESEIGMRDRFVPYGNTINLEMRHRSRSADRSNKSTTLDGTKLGEETRLNTVSIHYDVKELLPSRKPLAAQYRIFGRSSEVCEHNASVAQSALASDSASIWHLASLIVQQRVPLEILQSINSSQNDVAVIARRNISQLRHQDSGIDLSFDRQAEAEMMGSIRWGNNPLGFKYLVTAIFSYLEKKADVQMLAILSCIFAQSKILEVQANEEGGSLSAALCTWYQPSLEVADSLLQSQHALNNRFTLAVTKPGIAGKLEDTTTISANREPYHRRRNTASVVFRPDSMRPEDANSRDISITFETSGSGTTVANTGAISTSPEESRFNRRSNSGMAFAASKASLNALAQSFQHSPPSNNSTAGSSLKKFSPSATSGWAGSLFGSVQNSRASRASQAPSEANSDDTSNTNLRGSMSLANLQDLRRDSRRLRDSRGSLRSTVGIGNGKAGVPGKERKRTIRTSLHNQNHFDLDGHPEVSLLDPDLRWKYQMYRSAYADQLGAWGLFLQQAEMLQFNSESPDVTHEWHRSTPRTKAPLPKLEITKCCIECGSAFAAIEKNGVPIGWHCTTISCHLSSDKLSKNQVCSICQRIVRGLSVPCLQCGHLTCYDCAQGWFGEAVVINPTTGTRHDTELDDNSRLQSPLCPTGCGCPCRTLQSITVPYPPNHEDDHQAQAQQQQQQHVAPTPIFRQDSTVSVRSQRHKSEAQPGPDTALGAMMALSRSRAASAAMTRTAVNADPDGHGSGYGHAHGQRDSNNIDELVPWSGGKLVPLGRERGGGLSRGLSNRSSDATIRRA